SLLQCMWRLIRDWLMRKHTNLVHVERHDQASSALDHLWCGADGQKPCSMWLSLLTHLILPVEHQSSELSTSLVFLT
ncbi:hypothetical protein SISNIDRAFT_455660, partial [Sistotremastrum niveocremeum HHB9708]